MEPSNTLNTLLSLVQASRDMAGTPHLLSQVVHQMMAWLEEKFDEFRYLEGSPAGERVLTSIELFHLSLQHLADYQRTRSGADLNKVLLLAYQAENELSEVADCEILSGLWAA
jgi:hypothetical protein